MTFFQCIFGPKLFMEYGLGVQKMYEPGGLEKLSDQILSTFTLMWNISYYASPLIVTFLYRRGYFVSDSIYPIAKITSSIGIIIVISLCIRGYGRSQSRTYTKMIRALEQNKSPESREEDKQILRLFDFDFQYWQVDFDVKNHKRIKEQIISPSHRGARSNILSTLPCQVAAYIAINTFGISMIYPGSIKVLQNYMRPMLISGRAKLVTTEKAKRYKIKTVDSNEIDTIYVDNRAKKSNGSTLVICSEGNAGFYEIGIMATPLSLKYSVLGWNHPGFEGSTGQPYPGQDKNAIEAVVQFAVVHLGFAFKDIILYGWSIGGFSSFWAASCFPQIKGIVLDATFDDVLYLAQSRMPPYLSGIVRIAIRDYCNLNNSEMIPNYNGPIILIRRTEDEVIAEDGYISTNRGNFLLMNLLRYRYPNIFKESALDHIKNVLSRPIETQNNTNDVLCQSRITAFIAANGVFFPMDIGNDYNDSERLQMAEYLFNKHIRDYKSTHCTPLPSEYFSIPWDINSHRGNDFLNKKI